jgi:hypothetical protein
MGVLSRTICPASFPTDAAKRKRANHLRGIYATYAILQFSFCETLVQDQKLKHSNPPTGQFTLGDCGGGSTRLGFSLAKRPNGLESLKQVYALVCILYVGMRSIVR